MQSLTILRIIYVLSKIKIFDFKLKHISRLAQKLSKNYKKSFQ